MAASVAFALPFVYSATRRPDTRTNNLCHHAKSLMQNVANKKFLVSNLCQNPKQSIQLINSFKFPIDFSSGTRPWTAHAFSASATSTSPSAEKTLYDYTVKDIDGNDVPLSKFKGKVLLVVNVASKCGLTGSNYTELSHLYEKYNTQGFEILAFPCNQFGGQEPGKNSEIKQFANTKFKAEFPIFDKVDVNGPQTAPVYNFLKSSKGGGLLGDGIKWNFEKFLVDKNGKVVERYLPTTSPFQIEKDIQKLLAA